MQFQNAAGWQTPNGQSGNWISITEIVLEYCFLLIWGFKNDNNNLDKTYV